MTNATMQMRSIGIAIAVRRRRASVSINDFLQNRGALPSYHFAAAKVRLIRVHAWADYIIRACTTVSSPHGDLSGDAVKIKPKERAYYATFLT